MKDPVLFETLFEATQARIGLGRTGSTIATRPLLDFQLAHGKARDAVHTALDPDVIAQQLGDRSVIEVRSAAGDRRTFLERPDLGKRLCPESESLLAPGESDAAFVIADGLSAEAVHRHAVPLLDATLARLPGWSIAPLVLAHQSRVALGDEIGARLGAAMVVMLIGERPGLTAADSLGVYLTWGPRAGSRDAERNCISNVRPPRGLTYEKASDLLAWLMKEARKRGETGVGLKDESSAAWRISGD